MDVALLVPATAGAAALALGGLALRVEQQRGRRLARLAREHGWHLARRDDVWSRTLEGEPFGRGDARRCTSVLTGTHRGRDVVAFDYGFRTVSTDGAGVRTQQVHRYAVGVVRLPAPLPLVELRPARVFRRGLEFESEDFNRRYAVRADDARTAYDVLPPRTLQLLLDRPELSLRLLGGCAVTWEPGRLDAAPLLARLDTVSAVLDGVPAFVWRDRGAGVEDGRP